HLLERRGMNDHLRVTRGLKERGVIAHVADAKRQQLLKVAVDDFVGGRLAMQISQAHVVLLRLIAREDGDARGPPHLAGEEPPHHFLPQRAGAAGHQDPFSIQNQVHFLHSSYGVGSAAIDSIIAGHEGGTNPVAARKRLASRLRSMTTDSSRRISTRASYATFNRCSRVNLSTGSAATWYRPARSGKYSVTS